MTCCCRGRGAGDLGRPRVLPRAAGRRHILDGPCALEACQRRAGDMTRCRNSVVTTASENIWHAGAVHWTVKKSAPRSFIGLIRCVWRSGLQWLGPKRIVPNPLNLAHAQLPQLDFVVRFGVRFGVVVDLLLAGFIATYSRASRLMLQASECTYCWHRSSATTTMTIWMRARWLASTSALGRSSPGLRLAHLTFGTQ